eukprot:GFUD01120421.1.p1 GENE.GFUD01120421.1~~GFUD01120421.1.p1  ORF type:complete len:131 (+),score=28.24 GFUD01120421.1:45-437(+)
MLVGRYRNILLLLLGLLLLGVQAVKDEDSGPPPEKTLPWKFGMEPQVICVETGTTVIFDKTGSHHNVNQLTESEYNTCTGFTDTQGNSDNPVLYQADSPGVFYFACGVGSGFHCSNGGMKAQVTVTECPE